MLNSVDSVYSLSLVWAKEQMLFKMLSSTCFFYAGKMELNYLRY